MKLIADDKIPFINKLFSPHVKIEQLPGEDLTHKHLTHADILLVRSPTCVNATLLDHTPVQFVGTATAGIDHMDTHWLEQTGIAWASAPGCNAKAVADYVLCCLAALQQQQLISPNFQVGIIGVGNVGSEVARSLQKLNIPTIYHDPPRQELDKQFQHSSLDNFKTVDYICLHTPLTYTGNHPTYHLINAPFLSQLKSGCVLLNAGRGACIDQQAILATSHIYYCADVWEDEPNINPFLLKKAILATPHIAGYSLPAKLRASWMIYTKICQHFGWKQQFTFEDLLKENAESPYIFLQREQWQEQILEIYNPKRHTDIMQRNLLKKKSLLAKNFLHLRKTYPLRPEIIIQ